jgi:outer membrane protein assembly factor BamA
MAVVFPHNGSRKPPGRLPLLVALALILMTPAGLRAQRSGGADPRLVGLPVRTVVIHGLESMDEEVVRRRLELRTGGRWDPVTARRDERAVTGLMIFWSVRITAMPFPADGRPEAVEVHLHLEERIGWFVLPQLFWTPAESWSYGLYAGHFNFARRGHWAYLSAVTGGARYLGARLRNSWNGPHHESFSLGGAIFDNRNRLLDFDEQGERFHYRVGRWFGRRGRAEAAFEYRRLSGMAPSWLPAGAAGAFFEDRLVLVRATLGSDTSDPWAVPRLGRWMTFVVEKGIGLLGGTVEGDRIVATAVTASSLGNRLVVSGMGMLDIQSGDIPFWRALNLGGMNSVRGYHLGAWLVNRRWEVSGEVRWFAMPMRRLEAGLLGDQIVGISLACFADAGLGYGIRRGPDLMADRTPLLYSAGTGLYLHNALLGTLRLEIAWPAGAGPRWGFGLGTRF